VAARVVVELAQESLEFVQHILDVAVARAPLVVRGARAAVRGVGGAGVRARVARAVAAMVAGAGGGEPTHGGCVEMGVWGGEDAESQS